jgi:hemerythrin-like domain-containing protein
MPDSILALQLDHRSIAIALDVVQEQVTSMSRLSPVNHALLEGTLDYLSGYPDQCHHPREDLVYGKLVSRFPDLKDSLHDLVGEHATLGLLIRRLRQTVADAQRDPASRGNELAGRLRELLDFYRIHMRMEERHFFPLALRRLSRDDFAEIDFTLFDQQDPLFDRELEQRFASLHSEIVRSRVANTTFLSQYDQAAWLGTVQTIATFNEATHRAGLQLRLTRSTDGYDLEGRGGEVLVHIPACSETRAAWCAYFFCKALFVGGTDS